MRAHDLQGRYVGEPVGTVFAEDPYIAEDAELVHLDIEEMPPNPIGLAKDCQLG